MIFCVMLILGQRFPMARALSSSSSCAAVTATEDVHLIVLVHGWLGNPKEMGYLEKSLSQQARKNNYSVLVHSAECNNGRTTDGIAAGGSRLADEVNSLIKTHTKHNKTLSLSFVGNSLGGLYARYALSEIDFRHTQSNSIRPAVFCTTATPHLGVSQHTYIPLPRSAEYVIANALQPTGRDLLRYTSLIQEMTILDQFTRPLQAFEHRIAHVNAHQTDFQVPTATAGFVDPHSTSLHHVSPPRGENNNMVDAPSFLKLSVNTQPKEKQREAAENIVCPNPDNTRDTSVCNSTHLSELLDSMGWNKLFWDMRPTLPTMVPSFLWTTDASKQSSSSSLFKSKSTYTSQELYQQYTSFGGSVPFGHTMLVANSKNSLFERLWAGGKPVMDWVAQDLLERILHLDHAPIDSSQGGAQ